MALLLAILGLFNFPTGTVIGGLIIWYFLGDDIRPLFDRRRYAAEREAMSLSFRSSWRSSSVPRRFCPSLLSEAGPRSPVIA